MNSTLIANNIEALPDRERDRLLRLKQAIRRERGRVSVNFKFVGMVNGLLDGLLSRDGRLAFYEWIFERHIGSSKELTVPEMFGVVDWAKPMKVGERAWDYNSTALADLKIVYKVFGGGVGQEELPLSSKAHKQSRDEVARMLMPHQYEKSEDVIRRRREEEG